MAFTSRQDLIETTCALNVQRRLSPSQLNRTTIVEFLARVTEKLIERTILIGRGALLQATLLGLNVDLSWGLVMMALGVLPLYLARRAERE